MGGVADIQSLVALDVASIPLAPTRPLLPLSTSSLTLPLLYP